MPQVVLQSVFLLRYTASAEGIEDTFSLTLIIVSITASIVSIANKYAWFDEQAVCVDAKELNGRRPSKDGFYISWRFLLRVIWRWSDLCVRFTIFCLLWLLLVVHSFNLSCIMLYCLLLYDIKILEIGIYDASMCKNFRTIY